ncbi:hypothetical protein SY88_11570 [Clostridiales bacterium PH28_bin88]|nr:hypothetical protein SY88_11570 [Clostridiales bacterium PH28_bin88]
MIERCLNLIKYLLDTNIIIYNKKGLTPAVEFLAEIEENPEVEIIYSTIVEAELFSYPNLTAEDERQFEDALKTGEIIDVNSKIARKAGELRKISRNIYNKKLKLPDALVAATAMEHAATLITRNENDFNHLLNHGLSLYNPFK